MACVRETERPPVLAVSHSGIYHSSTWGIVLWICQSIWFLPTLSFGRACHSPLLYSELIELQQWAAPKACALHTNPPGLSNASPVCQPPPEEHLQPVLYSRSILSFYSSPSRAISPHLTCSSPCYFLCSSMCEYSETWLDFLAFILSNLPFYDGSLMSFTAVCSTSPSMLLKLCCSNSCEPTRSDLCWRIFICVVRLFNLPTNEVTVPCKSFILIFPLELLSGVDLPSCQMAPHSLLTSCSFVSPNVPWTERNAYSLICSMTACNK